MFKESIELDVRELVKDTLLCSDPVREEETVDFVKLTIFNKYTFFKHKKNGKIDFLIDNKKSKVIHNAFNFEINPKMFKNKTDGSRIQLYNGIIEKFLKEIVSVEVINSYHQKHTLFNINRQFKCGIHDYYMSEDNHSGRVFHKIFDNYPEEIEFYVQNKGNKSIVINKANNKALFQLSYSRPYNVSGTNVKILDKDNTNLIQAFNIQFTNYWLPILLRTRSFDNKKEIYALYKLIRTKIFFLFDEDVAKFFYSTWRTVSANYCIKLEHLMNIQNNKNTDIFKYHKNLVPLITSKSYKIKPIFKKYKNIIDSLALTKKELRTIEQYKMLYIVRVVRQYLHSQSQAEMIFQVKFASEYQNLSILPVGFAIDLVLMLQNTDLLDNDHRSNFPILNNQKFDFSHPRAYYIKNKKFKQFFNTFLNLAVDTISSKTSSNTKRTLLHEFRNVLDWFRYIQDSDFVFTKHLSWKRIKELSDIWHTEYNWAKSGRKNRSWQGLLNEERDYPGFIVEEITTTKRLVLEGQTLNHCVATYERACYSGQYRVVSIIDASNQSKRVTLGLLVHNNEVKLEQIRGYYNQNPTNNFIKVSEKIIQDINCQIISR